MKMIDPSQTARQIRSPAHTMRGAPWLAMLMALALGACTHAPWKTQEASSAASKPSPLIVVLIDGFRADYLDRNITPVMSGLAAQGVRAPMRPSTPSVSAPNHYTLMTGLYPDRHGMVDNTFLDPTLGFFGAEPASYAVAGFYEQATPLWVSAERQGVRVGSAYWGSPSVPIHGVRASHQIPYAENVPNADRVDRILAWFDLPEAERPRLFMLYFGSVDGAGHLYGPDAPQTNAAIADADAAIGRLVEGLRARNALDATNIVLVADHGMTEISRSRVILLSDLVDVNAVQETSYGATLGVNPKPGREAEVERALLKRHAHMSCWRKAEIPASYHYGANARAPAIFCLADPGWTIATPVAIARYPIELHGNHGFDPAIPHMAALFVARGPAFARGAALPAFDNIHVYPMLAHVLGVTPESVDGRLDVLRPALAAPQ
jgi:predicted AlkP superfamily pyrophosphatase or phosphodiesterase